MTRAVSGMARSQNRSSRRVSRRSGRGGECSAASDGHVSARPTAASGIPATTPLVALDDVLAAQEMTDPTQESRRGQSCPLDELHQLQLGMVEGWVSEGTLRRLAGLVDRLRPALTHPDLDAVLDEIELRAAIELAKLTRGPA
jgi:Class II flagellar assembly regulator